MFFLIVPFNKLFNFITIVMITMWVCLDTKQGLSFQSELLQHNSGRRVLTFKGPTHICSVDNMAKRVPLGKLFSQLFAALFLSSNLFSFYHFVQYMLCSRKFINVLNTSISHTECKSGVKIVDVTHVRVAVHKYF